MKTTNRPFQLEQTVPGTFFFQGLAGGLLAGFLLIVGITLWDDRPNFNWLIFFTPLYLAIAGTIGVLQATLIWGTYRLTRIQLRVPARVAITIFCIGLVAFLIALKQENVNEKNFAIGAGITFLTFLPIALLVGSSIKPWELFTFGSIANGKNANRSGSRSVLATLGTLPLRFMSIFALFFWTFTNACEREPTDAYDPRWGVAYAFPAIDISMALVLGLPVIYLLFSIYVSFRSPRKIILLISGLAINIPVVFIAFYSNYSNVIYLEGNWWSEAFFMIKTACTWFLIVWGLFLASRLSVRLNKVAAVNVLHSDLRNQKHHCLGSRFLEWQERNA